MPAITTADEIKKFLPPELPEEVTDEGLLDLADAAGEDIAGQCNAVGRSYSADSPRDVLLETLLTAYIARQTITGLAVDDASLTGRIWTTFEFLMENKLKTQEASGLLYTAPVGPGGRAGVGTDMIQIFRAPKPWWDKWRTTPTNTTSSEVDAEAVVSPPGRWD